MTLGRVAQNSLSFIMVMLTAKFRRRTQKGLRCLECIDPHGVKLIKILSCAWYFDADPSDTIDAG